jgi:hypothetical protein
MTHVGLDLRAYDLLNQIHFFIKANGAYSRANGRHIQSRRARRRFTPYTSTLLTSDMGLVSRKGGCGKEPERSRRTLEWLRGSQPLS